MLGQYAGDLLSFDKRKALLLEESALQRSRQPGRRSGLSRTGDDSQDRFRLALPGSRRGAEKAPTST